MKSAFFIFALALSSSAHALQVGDSATYTQTGSVQNHELVMTVTAINGDAYTASTLQDGSPGADATGSVANIEQINMIAQNCTQVGGNLVSIATPAGTFNSCHLTNNGTEIYLSADVTFGIVKITSGSDDIMIKSFVKH